MQWKACISFFLCVSLLCDCLVFLCRVLLHSRHLAHSFSFLPWARLLWPSFAPPVFQGGSAFVYSLCLLSSFPFLKFISELRAMGTVRQEEVEKVYVLCFVVVAVNRCHLSKREPSFLL